MARVSDTRALEAVERALELAPILDGHNDWAWRSRLERGRSVEGLGGPLDWHTDVRRLRAGRLGAQFWSVFVEDEGEGPQAVARTLEQIDWVHRLVERYPEDFVLARSAADVEAARAGGRIASLLGAEGAHSVDDSPGVLRMLAALGVRYLTLTHNRNSAWADSATDEERDGLTERGRAYIAELNRLGMLVDLSHVSARTMHDVLDVAQAPVIFSHSSCRALTDHPRNVPDDVLVRLAGNGGVIMVSFVPQFVSDEYRLWHDGGKEGEPPVVTLGQVADHIEHARAIAGVRHVGLGSDFDGVEHTPRGLSGVDNYPDLLAELAHRGWSAADLAALAGGNALRVLRSTDRAYAGDRPPTALIR
ncbi:dipeptidase [Amnibacterium sp. CER49]|uniref:dipeptidase n=1 Tax=Amnibacterium sp. CER49 TaxID=3039161 RepID=UPI00244884F6|nr:dipeptidase [Amnibacterium sp. CER49]MDH2445086.1 dipeptidase [Amnibacterium sp. CER49]